MKPIQVGLLGIGTVGSGTFNVLQRNQEEIRRRAGRGIEIAMVADLDTTRAKAVVGDGIQVVNDARAIIANPDIDIVIELIGGIEPARGLVLKAITVAMGVAGVFGAQTILNIGMCLYVAPVVGVTLPFFSYGGSSLLTAFGGPVVAPSATRRLLQQVVPKLPDVPGHDSSRLDVLTDREREVLVEIARGATNSEIAANLFMAEGTVKNYVSRIMEKLHARSRVELAMHASARAGSAPA